MAGPAETIPTTVGTVTVPTLPAELAVPVAEWLRANGQNIAEIGLLHGGCYTDQPVWCSRYDPDHHLAVMGVVNAVPLDTGLEVTT